MPRIWQRFEEVKCLGQGTFGTTYLVIDHTRNDEQVAIKVPNNGDYELAIVQGIANNAHLRASLEGMRHPNIVRFIDIARFKDRVSMIMEYVPGADLRAFVGPISQKRSPLDIKDALTFLEHACRGLKAAHDANLIHRDIKPENMLVNETDGLLKLIDFDLSRICQSTGSARTAAGTYPYMAPEIYDGKSSNAASDTWSLSVTAYEMLTGQLPFLDESIAGMSRKIMTSEPQPPIQLNPHIDRRLNDFILKGLNKNPHERYLTGGEMLERLLIIREGIEGEIRLALKMFREGEQDRAITTLTRLWDEFPKNPNLCLALARMHNWRWDFQESEQVLRRGLYYNGGNHQLHATLAEVLNSLGRKSEAKEERSLAKKLEHDQTN